MPEVTAGGHGRKPRLFFKSGGQMETAENLNSAVPFSRRGIVLSEFLHSLLEQDSVQPLNT